MSGRGYKCFALFMDGVGVMLLCNAMSGLRFVQSSLGVLESNDAGAVELGPEDVGCGGAKMKCRCRRVQRHAGLTVRAKQRDNK